MHARTVARALAIAVLPLTASACSGSSGSAPSPWLSSSTSAGATSPGPSGTSSGGESPSSDPSSSDTPSSGAPSTDASGKPSRQDATSGLSRIYTGQGMDSQTADQLASCMIDNGYTEFSATTLRAFANGRLGDMNPGDAAEFAKVGLQCAVGAATPTVPTPPSSAPAA